MGEAMRAARLVIGALALSVSSGAASAQSQSAGADLPLRYGKDASYNQVDNEDRIDQPDELKTAHTDAGALSADDLSKELSNPNSPLASLTFKHSFTRFKGDLPGADDQSAVATLFQPTFPFPLDDGGTTNLFIRPALAYVWRQPSFDPVTGTFESVSGWSDLGFDVAVGRSYDSGWVVVGGIQGTIPLDTDVSGDQWRLGPEFLAGKIGKKGFVVGFPSHQWDVGGEDYDYSTTSLELFAGVYLPNAWTVYTDSVLKYDWVNDQATIPINLTVRKVTKIGRLPVSISLAADYFIEQDDNFGQDWAITLNITPVVPNFVLGWFK